MDRKIFTVIIGIGAITAFGGHTGLATENSYGTTTDATYPDNLHEKPDVNLESLARLIHEYINGTRKDKGLHPLAYDTALADLAKIHSRDMAEFRYFDHVDNTGKDPTRRAKIYGYKTLKKQGSRITDGISENIIRIPLYKWVVFAEGKTYHWRTEEDIARTVLSGWLESPGHRKNLLNPEADREGIGVFITGDLRVYVTQDLW